MAILMCSLLFPSSLCLHDNSSSMCSSTACAVPSVVIQSHHVSPREAVQSCSAAKRAAKCPCRGEGGVARESCAPKLQVVVEGGAGRHTNSCLMWASAWLHQMFKKSLCYLDLPRLEKPVEAQLWSLVRRHVVGRATTPACTSF